MRRKYFTVEEANKLIPLVQEKIARLIRLKNTIAAITSVEIEYEDITYEGYLNDLKINKDFHRISYEFYRELEFLEKLGCFVKDVELGLADFLSIFEGREVFLCWKLGEDKVSFWHETDSGYNGRRPIYFLDKKPKQ